MRLKVKIMKRILIISLFIATLFAFVSCGKSPESKLVGTWKVQDVQTDFDENAVTPEMLRQMVELEKQTYFRILNDSVMIIISDNNTYETNWLLNHETNVISYFFEGQESKANELGRVEGDQVINESTRPFGNMSVYYEKE